MADSGHNGEIIHLKLFQSQSDLYQANKKKEKEKKRKKGKKGKKREEKEKRKKNK